MKIVLLVSAFNGLSQLTFDRLSADGHQVAIRVGDSKRAMLLLVADLALLKPDLIVCPMQTAWVPDEITSRWTTLIMHPGPPGDGGPSSLDRAIMEDRAEWGVTVLQAQPGVGLDAGDIWAYETFLMPPAARKSDVYNGPATQVGVKAIRDAVRRVESGARPTPLAAVVRPVSGTSYQGLLMQPDRAFAWTDTASSIIRKINAADGSPGVITRIADQRVYVYDASVSAVSGEPGAILGRAHGHVLVGAGEGSVWIGQAKGRDGHQLKLPAASVLLGDELQAADLRFVRDAPQEIQYVRAGRRATITVDVYNGAWSTVICRRLAEAITYASAERGVDLLVIRGGGGAWSNGIHLGVVEAAADSAGEAMTNLKAINAVCWAILQAPQLTIVDLNGNAGAGGVYVALCADHVIARPDVVLNPWYGNGLTGSELHTYSLQRLQPKLANDLLAKQLPISGREAARLGLINEVSPRTDPAWRWDQQQDAHTAWVNQRVVTLDPASKRTHNFAEIDSLERSELAEMARDLFDDRQCHAQARRDFLFKAGNSTTPPHLLDAHRGRALAPQTTGPTPLELAG